MDHYAVFGHPVAHSRSPWIHARFAAATGVSLCYRRIDAAPECFETAVRAFFAGGGHGANVTLPHKHAACALADVVLPRAHTAGAVNTLMVLPDGRIAGDNTDGTGLVVDLVDNHHVALAGSRVLLAGAGGAAAGVLDALLDARPASLCIVNRTPERARALGAARDDARIDAGGFELLARAPAFDVVINATAASLDGDTPPIPAHCIAAHSVCYDLAYAVGGTAFNAWARAHGAVRVLQGTGMLVEQAAESFRLWRGVRPPTAEVRTRLDRLLGAG